MDSRGCSIFKFPFELNEVTRAYFERTANIVGGSVGADMKAIVKTPPDTARNRAPLAEVPYYNARDPHHLRRDDAPGRPRAQRVARHRDRQRELPHSAGSYVRRDEVDARRKC